MATKREQFQALRLTGMDATKAQEQVYGIKPAGLTASVTPAVANIGGEAPVAPSAPSAPSAPVPSTPAQPQMVVPASMQEPVAPATIVPAAPIAPTKAPEAPKFMTEVEREAKLGQVQDNQASKDQMLANVGIMTKEDPNMATDRAKFDAKTGYVGKSPEEKAILDQYFQANVPKTAGDIRKQLQTGVAITDKNILNTTAYRQAKFEQDRFSKYNSMNTEQLFSELRAGNIPSSIQNELASNPNFSAAKQKEAQSTQIDNTNASLKSFMGTPVETVDPLTKLSETLTAIYSTQDQSGSTAEAFKSYISQNPEITQPTAEYNQKYGQKKELERAREQLVTDLKKKYAGEPLSTIMVMAANQAEPLNLQINTLNDSLNLLAADIKNKTDFATQEFGFYQQDQQAQQAKQQKLQEVLGGLAISQFGRQQDQAFDLKKEEIKQKFENDQMATRYIQDLNKIGIQNVYDLQRAEFDFGLKTKLAAIDQRYKKENSVLDLKNEMTKLGFQAGLQQQARAFDLQDQKSLMDYKASLDPELAEKWQAIADKATANTTLADLYGTNVGTYKGNRGYDLAGKMGDALVAPPGAKVVEVRTQDGSQYFLENGQAQEAKGKDVGYGNSVLLQLPDGKYMRLSHLQDINVNLGDDLSGGAVVGTRGNTGKVLGKGGETLTPEQLAAGRGAHVDVEIGGKLLPNGQIDTGSLLSSDQQKAYLGSIKPFASQTTEPLTDKQYTQFNQAVGRFTGNPQVKAFEAALSSGGDLVSSLNSENWPGDVSAVFQFMKTLDPASVVREGEFALAESSAGLPSKIGNLYDKVMKGERLTDDQRKAFGKIAFKFIENKAKLYDSHYNDMTKVLKLQKVPESYFPTKVSDYINQYSQWSEGDQYDNYLNNLSK
jgi:murein DD-endopeptidase MepM/ murein hydrolase activator NlpD